MNTATCSFFYFPIVEAFFIYTLCTRGGGEGGGIGKGVTVQRYSKTNAVERRKEQEQEQEESVFKANAVHKNGPLAVTVTPSAASTLRRRRGGREDSEQEYVCLSLWDL